MLWHSTVLPGRLAQLTCDSKSDVCSALAQTKNLWEVWQVARERPEEHIKALCTRSFMNWALVQETCAELAAPDLGGLPVGLKDHLVEAFSVQPTKVIEDSLNAMRHVEQRHQSSNGMTFERKGRAPIGRGILGEQHSLQ